MWPTTVIISTCSCLPARAHGFGSVEFSIWQSHRERSLKITCKMCFHPWLGLYILLVGIILNGGKKQAFFFTHSHSESNLMSLGVSNWFNRESISHVVLPGFLASQNYYFLLIYICQKNTLFSSAGASPFSVFFPSVLCNHRTQSISLVVRSGIHDIFYSIANHKWGITASDCGMFWERGICHNVSAFLIQTTVRFRYEEWFWILVWSENAESMPIALIMTICVQFHASSEVSIGKKEKLGAQLEN